VCQLTELQFTFHALVEAILSIGNWLKDFELCRLTELLVTFHAYSWASAKLSFICCPFIALIVEAIVTIVHWFQDWRAPHHEV
jgi:hypothetical protein